MVARCLSSELMTDLLQWRNPQGAEDNWWGRPERERIDSMPEHLAAVGATELALCLLVTVALVETAAYTAFTAISILFIPLSDDYEPFNAFSAALGSSTFTIFWGIADLFNNILPCTSPNLITHESFARYHVGIMRREDDAHVNDIEARLRPRPPQQPDPVQPNHAREVVRPGDVLNEMERLRQLLMSHRVGIHNAQPQLQNAQVNNLFPQQPNQAANQDPDLEEDLRQINAMEAAAQQAQPAVNAGNQVDAAHKPKIPDVSGMSPGARFIVEDVLPSLTPASQELFKEQEAAIFQFFLAKSVFIYALGKKAKDPIPDFFTSETQQTIAGFRSKRQENQQHTGEIETAFECWDAALGSATDPTSADALEISDEKAQKLFTEIKEAGLREIQGKFLKICATEAIKSLS